MMGCSKESAKRFIRSLRDFESISSMPTSKKSSTKAKKTTKKSTRKKAAKKVAKSTAKQTAKKSVTKKSKKPAAKPLVVAKEKECFWTNDGQVLKDLQELSVALDKMAEEVFKYHVTKERNDFADWVDSVLSDTACAEALRKSRKPSTAKTVVVRHLKYYVL